MTPIAVSWPSGRIDFFNTYEWGFFVATSYTEDLWNRNAPEPWSKGREKFASKSIFSKSGKSWAFDFALKFQNKKTLISGTDMPRGSALSPGINCIWRTKSVPGDAVRGESADPITLMKKYLLSFLVLAAFGCEPSKPELSQELSPKAQKAKHQENIKAFEARVKLLYPNSQVLHVASIGPVRRELDVYVYRVVGVVKYDLNSEYEPKQKWTTSIQLLCAEGACWAEPKNTVFGSND